MNKWFFSFVTVAFIAALTSCKKGNGIDIPVVPPSDGKTQTMSGGAGGANAVNSVFIDLSTDRQDSVLRSSWDLGFATGPEFRVILNYTTSAGAKVLNKTDLNQVTPADTAAVTLAVSQVNPQPSDLVYFDDASGNLSQTVIPAISSTEADNKVIILNRGTGGGVAARPWLKLRILRSTAGDYTVQYAPLAATTFQTATVVKNPEYNFIFLSLDNGNSISVEPKKGDWDIQWTYSVFKTSFGAGDVPYNFSDLVAINSLAGVQAAEVLTTTSTYAAYNENNIAATTFSNNRWIIGSNWRLSGPTASGVKTDRFYVIRDAANNIYKLKFISFHASDGGVRGYPVIEYKLVKQG